MLRIIIMVIAIAITAVSITSRFGREPDKFVNVPVSSQKNKAGMVGLEPGGGLIEVKREELPARDNPLSGRFVRLDMDARGHFVADSSLNGRHVTAMVDTGATFVAINSSMARHIGLRLQPSDFRHRVSTANGAVEAAFAIIGEIRIGRITVDNVEAVILPDSALDIVLLGMSFLRELDSFGVEQRTLVLKQ